MLQEIDLKQICEYKDPFSLFDEDGVTVIKDKNKINPMTIGWGSLGILWSKPCATVYIHQSRYSKELFDKEEYFSICFFSQKYQKEVAYFGTVSGRYKDKIKDSGLTVDYIDDIPYIKETELVILCHKMTQNKFDLQYVNDKRIKEWYTKGGVHSLYFGEILKIFRNK